VKNLEISVHNIFKYIECQKGAETFDLIAKKGFFKIVKTVSNGAKSPDGFWYDQPQDEFVLLLSGRAKIFFEKGKKADLKRGDYILIPRRVKHRVEYTSEKPKCVWLCVFGKFCK
jgi:cupin 2 domain-containing protein